MRPWGPAGTRDSTIGCRGRFRGAGHRRDPLADQRQSFLVHQPLAELGHHDAGVGRVDPIDEDRLVGLPGDDVELAPARAAARRDRRLEDAVGRGVGLRGQQIEPRVPRGAFGVVAVGTVDLEPGACPGVEAAALRIVPDRESGCGAGGGAPAKRPARVQCVELVLGPRGVGEVAVQMAGLRADRRDGLARLVAALALVGIGDDVVVRPRLAVGMDPPDVERAAGDLERGLGLGLVPDVREADPAVGLALEDPGLDQPLPFDGSRASCG